MAIETIKCKIKVLRHLEGVYPVERAHFQKIFEIYAKREQTDRQIPLALRQAISHLQLKGIDGEPLKLGQGE